MAKKVEREILNINNHENKWKIKTNTNKFKIIPPAIRNTHPVTVEGNIIPYSKEGILLG